MTEFLAILRYFAAHVAAFGGTATAIYLFLTAGPTGYPAALAALLTALAGFGGTTATPPVVAHLRALGLRR
jgi:hypothetical protein